MSEPTWHSHGMTADEIAEALDQEIEDRKASDRPIWQHAPYHYSNAIEVEPFHAEDALLSISHTNGLMSTKVSTPITVDAAWQLLLAVRQARGPRDGDPMPTDRIAFALERIWEAAVDAVQDACRFPDGSLDDDAYCQHRADVIAAVREELGLADA